MALAATSWAFPAYSESCAVKPYPFVACYIGQELPAYFSKIGIEISKAQALSPRLTADVSGRPLVIYRAYLEVTDAKDGEIPTALAKNRDLLAEWVKQWSVDIQTILCAPVARYGMVWPTSAAFIKAGGSVKYEFAILRRGKDGVRLAELPIANIHIDNCGRY